MPKHTPGPWEVRSEPGRCGYDLIIFKDVKVIAEMICPTWSGAVADANLIAAAPDMYEALKEIHALLEENQPSWYLQKHYNVMKKAITKAEGKEKMTKHTPSNLVAAAPEMYAVLKLIMDEDMLVQFANEVREYPNEPVINALTSVFPDIEKVIAKAEGGEENERL